MSAEEHDATVGTEEVEKQPVDEALSQSEASKDSSNSAPAAEVPAPTEEASAHANRNEEHAQDSHHLDDEPAKDTRQLDEDPAEASQHKEEAETSKPHDDTFEDNGPPARPFDEEGRPLKVYIGNLSGACKMFNLREKFSQFGTVTNVELKTNIGCGFVQFTTAEAADAACRGMDGQDFLDQKIRVEPQRAGGPRGPKFDGPKSSDGCFNCGSRGHWSKHCPNPPTNNYRGRGRGRGRGGYHSYDSRPHHGSGGYDSYPPRRQEYHDPYARDPYAAAPREQYGAHAAARDPYYSESYSRDPYNVPPPPHARDPYARADPYAHDPYARGNYMPPRPQADPYYRDSHAAPAGPPPRDYYDQRDDGRQQYRRGATPPDASYGRDAYAQPDMTRRRSRSPYRRAPAPHDDYDYRYAAPPPVAGNGADPYAAPDAYYGQTSAGGGYADYDRGRGRSRSPPAGANGGSSYGYA